MLAAETLKLVGDCGSSGVVGLIVRRGARRQDISSSTKQRGPEQQADARADPDAERDAALGGSVRMPSP